MSCLRNSTHPPHCEEHEDSLGKPGGSKHFDHANKAKFTVAVQNVKSVGRRPIDWMKRDLLPGATGDDRRSWAYRKVLENDSTFLVQSYDKISKRYDDKEPERDYRTVIREMRAFDYLHRLQLLFMQKEMVEYSYEFLVAAAAAVCPTSLYETGTRIPHELNHFRKSNVCRNIWVCPHCYARSMSKYFFLAQDCLKREPTAYLALLSEEININIDVDFEEYNSQCSRIRSSLLNTAKRMGGTGGLWTVQLSPILEQNVTWNCNEIRYENIEKLTLRVAVLSGIPKTLLSLKRMQKYQSGSCDKPPEILLDIRSGSTQSVLRALIIKKREFSWPRVTFQNNNYGLFYWPALTLCSPQQWRGRFRMTHGKKSVQAWGSWTQSSKQPSIVANELTSSPQISVSERREHLWKNALAVLNDYGWPNGPAPGRGKFQELLSQSKITASERDVRWLILNKIKKEL